MDLEVHRIVPKSDYEVEWGVCLTLCDVCHDALHGKGSWGWVTKDAPEDEEAFARLVRRSTARDIRDERKWRRRASWGVWLQELRKTVAKISQRKLACLLEIPMRKVQNWEAGRDEPLFSEAKRLATVLGIHLEELWCDDDPDDWWLTATEKRADARALAFGAREAKDGEILERGAALVAEVVGNARQERAKAREAEEERKAAWLPELNAKAPVPRRIRFNQMAQHPGEEGHSNPSGGCGGREMTAPP